MQRVVVLGPVGAGKSTLARAISTRTGLPVVYLDHLFWRPGWTPAPQDEALRDLDEAIARDEWILDGNFLANGADGADRRFERADTVIFLDQSRLTCLWRVATRIVRYRSRSRADLPEGCPESYDRSLLRWDLVVPDDRPSARARAPGGSGRARRRPPSPLARGRETLPRHASRRPSLELAARGGKVVENRGGSGAQEPSRPPRREGREQAESVATGCHRLPEWMVRRGSTVQLRQRALLFSLL